MMIVPEKVPDGNGSAGKKDRSRNGIGEQKPYPPDLPIPISWLAKNARKTRTPTGRCGFIPGSPHQGRMSIIQGLETKSYGLYRQYAKHSVNPLKPGIGGSVR